MRKVIIVYLLFIGSLNAQSFIGSFNSSSNSKNNPFVVGDIYIDGNNGILGVYSNIVNNKVGNSKLVYDNIFEVYPNPTSDILKVKNKDGIIINSIEIINVLGNSLGYFNAESIIDISDLETGIYFIKINNKFINKFIKL